MRFDSWLFPPFFTGILWCILGSLFPNGSPQWSQVFLAFIFI